MSVSGLNQQYLPNTLDGLNIVEADQVYIDGQLVNLSDYVTYENATRTLNMGAQNIQTSHDATTGNDVVNKTHLDNVVSNLSIAIAGSFLDKVTTTPQTVVGNVSYTAQLSADDLFVPTTKKASLGSVLTVDANYRRSETDSTISVVQYFGSISSSMGIYQATSTQNYAILQVADLGVSGTGKRMDINWNLNINEASYNSSIQLFASDNGTNTNQYLGSSVSFTPSDSLYKVMSGTFVPQYRYICALCITSKPSGIQTVRWYGLQLDEQGVDITALTMSAQNASQIPIINDKKQLVGSGVSSSKVIYLDNCNEDIQSALNNRLKLDGSNANQNIIIGGYKVQSSATPTTGNDYTNKTYVDGAISGAGALYLLKAGDTATGTILNSAGNFHAYRGGDLNRGCILYANNADGATYASHNGGLASWYGIGFTSTLDNTARFVFNTRDGNSSQTGTLTANAVNVDGQTASRVCVLDASKNIVSSSVTSTTLSYLDIGSSLTGLLNAKGNLTGGNTWSGDQIFNSGTVSVYNRLLGLPDATPTGNFWMGLRGSGTEVDRLAISIVGNITTGVVDRVLISKVLRLSQPTANRVLTLDANGDVVSSTVTPTTLSYLDIGSSLTGLLNAKANLAGSNTFTGSNTFSSATPITLSGLTASRALALNASGNIVASATTATELDYLSGTTSSVQGQINTLTATFANYLPLTGGTLTGLLKINPTTSENRKLVLYDGGLNNDFQYYGLGINAYTLRFNIDTTASRYSFFAGTGSTSATEIFRINGVGGAETGISGTNASTTPFLKASTTSDHYGGNPTEVWLFNGYNGHLGIAKNATQNGSTTNLMLGVADTEESQVISLATNNLSYKPLNFAASQHNFVGGDIYVARQYNLNLSNGNDSSNFTSRNQITMGWQGSGWQYRHAIKTEHNGGVGPTSNDNSMSFYLWSNNDAVGTVGTNLKMSIAGGGVGINVQDPSAQLHVGGGSGVNYTNCCILKADGGAAINLDSTGATGGHNYSLLSGITGYGIGTGGFGIYDITASAYRFGITSGGRVIVNGTDQAGLFTVYNGSGEDFLTLYNGSFAEGTYINQRFLFGGLSGSNRSAYIQAYKTNNEARLKFFTSDSGGGVSERFVVRDNGIDVTGNAIISGNLSATTISAVNASVNTYQNTSNRLLFRDGSGVLTVGACSFWRYKNDSIAWTYGTTITNAFYVPSTTASIVLNITGSGYSTFTGGAMFNVLVADSGGNYYTQSLPFYFNQTYVHTQVTQHIVIPPNSWGALTIGYKSIYVSWITVLQVASDVNDTLQFSVEVIG